MTLVRDERALALCARILGSYRTETGRGLPIGNLTSQLWGNFVLDPLDHRLAERERHGEFALHG